MTATSPARSSRYLALGDSYTIGEGIDVDGRWPMQLARALRAEGIALADPRIIATTGWTTDELAAAIDAAAPASAHALVSLAVGVNDQYRGRGVDTFGAGFDALLVRATGLAGGDPGRVLVLSIPDWGVTPFGAASGRDLAVVAFELDAYNARLSKCCERRGIAQVDVTATSRALGNQPAMLVDDALHPSAAMYLHWVRLALPVARRMLATDRPSP